MKTPNRDLLVLVKDEFLSEEAIENELERLNKLLLAFETMENYCLVHEVIDMNKYKVLCQARVIRQVIRQKELKPFVFIFNKN